MGTRYAPRVVTDGLVCAYDPANKLSYSGSGTVISDVAGSGVDGWVHGSSTFSSNNLGNIQLPDTTSPFIIYPTTLGLDMQNETHILWAKCSTDRTSVAGGSWNERIIHMGTYYGNNSGGFGLQSATVSCYLKGSTSSGWSTTGTSSTGNTIYDTYDWIYYVMTIENGTTWKLSMNNTSIFTRTVTDSYTGYGSNSIQYGQLMDMDISLVQIYNRVLTDDEITQNYIATRGRFGV